MMMMMARAVASILLVIFSCAFYRGSLGTSSVAPVTPLFQGIQKLLTCEGQIMVIECPSNTTIAILSVKYGQEYAGYQCISEEIHGYGQIPCLSSRAHHIVYSRCSKTHRRTCTIPVNKDTLGKSPCDETVSVYLSVAYLCISLFTPTVPPTDTPAVFPQSSDLPSADLVCSPCVGCVKCLRCLKRNITWPETPAGNWANAACPNNENLREARLFCGSNPAKWIGHPDLSRCISSKVDAIQKQLRNLKNLEPHSLRSLTGDLVTFAEGEKSLAGGDLVGISQAMYDLVDLLSSPDLKKNLTQDVKHQVSKAAVAMANSLLHNQRSSSWTDLPKTNWGSVATTIMTTVETSAFQIADELTSPQKVTNVTDQLVLEVAVIEAGADGPAEDAVFPSVDSLRGSLWENTRNSFRFPAESLMSFAQNGRTKIIFTSYNNLENLLLPSASGNTLTSSEFRVNKTFCSSLDDDQNCDAIINTKIISASVKSPKMRSYKTQLTKPVVFTLQHQLTVNVSSPICAYWKLADGGAMGGEWMTEGCEMLSTNATHTTCSCNHLTSFAVIMSPTSPEITGANALALDVLTYIGCSISIICLFLSFLTFACFRGLQCDRNTIHKNLVLCLFVANMIFLIGIDLASLKVFCSVIAGFLHYFFLTVFAWMCIEGIQLYYMLIEVFEADKSHVLWFYLSAYGFPAVVVTISAAVYHQGYGTDRYCWLTTENGFIWAFLAPVAAIIVVNSVMLGIALKAMYQHSVSAAAWRMKEKTKLQQIRSWVKGSVVLIVLLGLTWLFGFLFVNQATIAFAYIFTILNSLQGLFIFVFHCLLNDKVQNEYKRCVRNATWLPERFRVWYGGARTSFTSNPNQSRSSSGPKFPSRLLSRQRKSSNNTSISRLTSSQKRQSLLKQEEEKNKPGPVIAPDSGIEDPSSYLESAQIHVGESEFNTIGYSSAMEGSVADTDYGERLVQRPGKVKPNGEEIVSAVTTNDSAKELQTEAQKRNSQKKRNTGSVSQNTMNTDQGMQAVENSSQYLDGSKTASPNSASIQSQKTAGQKRKSIKSQHQNQDFDTPDALDNSRQPYKKEQVDEIAVPRQSLSRAPAAPVDGSSRTNSKVPKSTGV